MMTSRIAAFFLCIASAPPSIMWSQATDAEYKATISRARQTHEDSVKQPDGFLTLVALHQLPEGKTTVGSGSEADVHLDHGPKSAVILARQGNSVTITPGEVSVSGPGGPLAGPTPVKINNNVDEALHWDTFSLQVLPRGDRLYVRIRDTEAPTLKAFTHLNFYPIDQHYRIQARWVPYRTPHDLVIPNEVGQEKKEPSPGYAEFRLQGRRVRLAGLDNGDGRVWILFRDRTSNVLSYGGGRNFAVPAPSNGLNRPGTITLDFNQAYNFPCAYTAFGTCPLPPAENIIEVSIPAGEQRYHTD